MKKKLGLLAGLALCVTVGGVYATWNYAQTGNVAQVNTVTSVVVPEAVVSTVKGSLEVTHNTMTIRIDDLENDNDHKAELVFEGEMTIKFTPAAGADLKTMSLVLEADFTDAVESIMFTDVKADGNENKAVFSLTSAVLTKTFNLTSDAADKFEWKITASELQSLISINELYLETLGEFNDFRTQFNGTKLPMLIKDVTTVTP